METNNNTPATDPDGQGADPAEGDGNVNDGQGVDPNANPDNQPGDGDPTGGQPTEGNQGGDPNDAPKALKDVLGETLKRTFSSDEEALNAVKETQDFVGKSGQYNDHMKTLKEHFNTDEAGVLKIMTTITPNDGGQTDPPADNQPTAEPKPADSKPDGKGGKKDDGFISKDQYESDQFYAKNGQYEPYKATIEALRATSGQTHQQVVESNDFKPMFEAAEAQNKTTKQKSILDGNSRVGGVKDKMGEAKKAAQEGNHAKAADKAVEGVIDAFAMTDENV